jgi:ubiquinone/menaquinone biosynthesis C-methylase UbiE
LSQSQNNPLADYYAKRASEYERIYSKPERQHDLLALRGLFQQQLADQNVLEIPCGTGYWTQAIAHAARSIVAVDINDEVLEIARTKPISQSQVNFRKLDAFRIHDALKDSRFTAALSVFWWSHLKKSETETFLAQLQAVLPAGAAVIFADNCYVPGSNTPISRTDAEGNTYQTRRLANGEEFEVLKNFPRPDEVEAALAGIADHITWKQFQYFWVVTGRMI